MLFYSYTEGVMYLLTPPGVPVPYRGTYYPTDLFLTGRELDSFVGYEL
jgi:hypothetical protein